MSQTHAPAEAPIAPEPVAHLLECTGPRAGFRHPLAAGEQRLGRDPGADVVIDDPDVSRLHLRFEVDPLGVEVADLGSKNGALVDGSPLTQARRLVDGAVISVGEVELELEHAGSRMRRAVQAGGDWTVTRTRVEAASGASTSLRVPLTLTIFFSIVVLFLLWVGR